MAGRYPRNVNKKRTDKSVFSGELTAEELNHLRKDDRNPAVALRARKPLLKTLLLQDDLGDETMASLLDVLLSVSKTGGDDAKEVYRFLASRQFIKVHMLLFVLKCRMNIDSCCSGNILLKVISVLMAFYQLGLESVKSFQMVAAVLHDTIEYGVNIPDRKRYANGLTDVTMILNNEESGKEESAEDICNIPIFPTAGEVADPDIAVLCDATTEEGPSVKNYLECHYRLLREDIVQPLRAVISKYHQVKREMGLDAAKRECHIIDDVKLHEIITTHPSKGVTFRVQFDTSSLQNVSWETTRIMSFGNMVCLTNNHFHDMIFATVAKRDPQWLKQGFVDLRLFRQEDTGLLVSGAHFFMIDSRKYVEESHTVLDAMRQIGTTSFPLVSHVVYQMAENENIPDMQYDVGPLMKDEHTARRSRNRTWHTLLLNKKMWPPTDQLCVDEHQLAAIQAALTKKLTVITGPPGTGKTYVGLKLIQIFVLNKDRWSHVADSPTKGNDGGPLLFMCASKETLDDCLTGVSFFQRSGIVRWAGQYTRKTLEGYQIENLREDKAASIASEDHLSSKKLENRKRRLGNVQVNIANLRTKIFPEEILKVVMDEKHYQKLKAGTELNSCSVILEWLLSDNSCGDDMHKLEEGIPFGLSRFTCQDGDGDAWFEQSLPFVLDSLAPNLSYQTRIFVSKQFTSRDKMTDSESKKVEDVWGLHSRDRWRIYQFWISKLEARGRQRAIAIFKEMEQICLDCQKMHDVIDESILSSASVIGMTASSAAKNRRVLQRINPRVIIIEEGADVLQSITSGIIPSACQQLIIIGDNVPKVDQFQAVRKIADVHGIHATLMQQLVEKNYSVYELKTQHRMSPASSKLSRQLFSYEYQSDQSVIDLPSITGIKHNVFLIDHNIHTSPGNHEASLLLELFSYLLGQGFSRKQISILVSFPAQQKLFGNDMKDRLLTVDNFRGGNDIVLFMSNGSERGSRPGGLLTDQRIATVLSGAGRGFCLRRSMGVDYHVKLAWTVVMAVRNRVMIMTLSKQKSFASSLATKPSVKMAISAPGIAPNHVKRSAERRWKKQLSCGHFQRLPCLLSPSHATCRDKCERLLSCGHKCAGICGNPCKKEICVEKTKKSNWPCKHTVEVRCCDGPESCPEPCNFVLACGHPCSGTCGKCRRGRLHVVCQQPCGRTLVCGHSCESNCAAQCPPCTKQCQNRCQHSECRKLCGEACIPCKESCLWRCSHVSCAKLCGEPCNRKPCNEPCKKNLPCGHPCIGMCGERCPTKCRVCNREEVTELLFGSEDEEGARFVQLEDCGHVIEVEALDQYMSMTQDSSDDVTIQLKGCPKCKTPIRRNLRYGNIIKQTLGDVENVKTKMRGSESEIESKMNELRAKLSLLRSHTAFRDRFLNEEDLQKLIENLTQRKHLERILACLNRCAFLRAIADIRAKVSTAGANFEFNIRKQAVEMQIRELKNEVVWGELDKFTDQQMNDVQQEISRANLQTQAMMALTRNMAMLNRNMQSRHLRAFDSVVDKDTPFTSEKEVQATRLLRQLKQEVGHVVLGITDQERVEIVKAIGLSQGHWYKCPKGHVYAIGECGGAMEETKCPECGAKIGGGRHRLTAGNRVANEMDGATQAAWPTAAVIGYEDYQEEDQGIDYAQELGIDLQEQFEIERQLREVRYREWDDYD
ncbi:NFX1-type zinc finger-containing protein 1 [Strongylocentrotus purpuratus]|uniref:RZ-type domain-containing protein n=1 Tax=Strongylocentrotus purpuratus TaxID=7668 RepID=A0A7M7PEJ6_STRPU|nr:NFX1-type zinc finger-containing protein 1 [Strongylocentrotus purpuratus]